jgi:hypothetical protein
MLKAEQPIVKAASSLKRASLADVTPHRPVKPCKSHATPNKRSCSNQTHKFQIKLVKKVSTHRILFKISANFGLRGHLQSIDILMSRGRRNPLSQL